MDRSVGREARHQLVVALVAGAVAGFAASGLAQTGYDFVAGRFEIQSTDAKALDVAGGAQFGSGDVALIGTDGKINGPLSSTIIDDLSGANLTTLDAGNISTGTLASARGGVPANAILFTISTSCPTGYTEYTTLRGRYVVGLVATGTSAATVGTALTDSENRAVGQHTHTQNAHNHGITDPGHTHTYDHHGSSGSPFTALGTNHGNFDVDTDSSTTGITIDNSWSAHSEVDQKF